MGKGRLAASLAVLMVLATCGQAHASAREWLLFGGVNTDTTEQASPWIPIKGANRVVFKMWTTHSGTYTGSDSTRTDSLVTFKLLFSDSLCCTITDLRGQTIRGAADSIVADAAITSGAGAMMDTTIWIGPNPINKTLRAPATGTGRPVILFPVVKLVTGSTHFPDWVMPKNYVRVRCTPLTRLTPGGALSTQGIRTAGLKGFKMTATVYYDDVNGH